MKKTLLYRLFGIGGIPKKVRPSLEAEGILICDEGIGGWMIMKNFKAPGKRFKHRMEGFSGFLALTNIRLISYAYGKRIVNVPLNHPKIAGIHCAMVNPNKIELSFDAAVFQDDREGMITLRYNTPMAQQFCDKLASIIAI
ncbi:MAG TPA: hypothetical protein VMY18_07060 [Acidobacteriota bacterium]|nr:hypothetical protein [Acidobacteriota bacterium]